MLFVSQVRRHIQKAHSNLKSSKNVQIERTSHKKIQRMKKINSKYFNSHKNVATHANQRRKKE